MSWDRDRVAGLGNTHDIMSEIKKHLITLSSDFGAMEAIIFEICPEAKVVHLCHTIRGFDIKEGARMLEGVAKLPIGFHVGVVDPGVGTKRKGIAIQTKRGDFLIGPDNGLLRPAAEFLGGIIKAWELSNDQFHRKPVSPIFHGRDIFAPVAAYLAKGISPDELGPKINSDGLIAAPYHEALWNGDQIEAEVIHINGNGSVFLNIKAEEFTKRAKQGDKIAFHLPPGTRYHTVNFQRTFGEVAKGEPVILKDDFGRIELAINQDNFALTFDIKRGQKLILKKEK